MGSVNDLRWEAIGETKKVVTDCCISGLKGLDRKTVNSLASHNHSVAGEE